MKCSICLSHTHSIAQAVLEGWEPSFYEGPAEHGPACPSCSAFFLGVGEKGVLEVKQQYRGRLTYSDGDYSDSSGVQPLEPGSEPVRGGMEG